MVKIIDISGKEQEIDCRVCAINSGEVELPIERIAETKNFALEQDFEYPIEGFMILASKRHIQSIDEFSKDEEEEFFPILKRARETMREVLGINKVTIIQEEIDEGSHFHVWLFPWHDWMKPLGSKLNDVRNLMRYAKENFSDKENLDKIKEAGKKLKSKF